MAQKKVCLTCKNKGCVNFCRFVNVAPKSQQQDLHRPSEKRAA